MSRTDAASTLETSGAVTALEASSLSWREGTPAVETRGLTKRFGQRMALDGVDLRVPVGSAFGFLGPNGAGKTTMIRMLLGLTHASAGTMSLLGRPVPAERATALREVGAIVEEPRFHPQLSGRENLLVIAAARGPQVRARIAPALERVGLAQRADEKVKRYSLGMRQRLGVARCLLADPRLLILDEPTNGLDPQGIQEFREMIRAMVEREGRTVFLSSHLLDEVEKICDAAAIVDRGRVVAQGPISELAGGHARDELIIGVDNAELAERMLAGSPLVSELHQADGALRVVLARDLNTAADLNATLVSESCSAATLRLQHLLNDSSRKLRRGLSSALSGCATEDRQGVSGGALGHLPRPSHGDADLDSARSPHHDHRRAATIRRRSFHERPVQR